MAGFEGIRITILETKGSTPRAVGAWAWVDARRVLGSIGGGRMEAEAVALAREMLARGEARMRRSFTLGPEMAQCCGGVVALGFEACEAPAAEVEPLAIFGAGHVGSVLARMAEAVPFAVQVFDNRERIELERSQPYQLSLRPELEVDGLSPASHVVILTHDHGLDFRIAERALLRDDLGFVGMIGSKTKAAQFRSEFRALGSRLERLHSPIEKTGADKRPAAIALAILQGVYGFGG